MDHPPQPLSPGNHLPIQTNNHIMRLQTRLPRRPIMIHHHNLNTASTLQVQRRHLFIAKVLKKNA
jgi:hypothetical protein